MGLIERLQRLFAFSRPQMTLASAIASLPGGFILLVFNYLYLGKRKHALICLLCTLLLSGGAVVLFLVLPSSRLDRFFPLLSCVLMLLIGRSVPAFASSWLSWILAIVLALVWLGIEIVLGALLYPFVHD